MAPDILSKFSSSWELSHISCAFFFVPRGYHSSWHIVGASKIGDEGSGEEGKVLSKLTFSALQAALLLVGNAWIYFPQGHFIGFGELEDDSMSV